MRDRLARWLGTVNETLVDLIIGSLLYSALFEVIGIIFVESRLQYTLGLVLGTGVSVFCAWSIYHSLNECLDMSRKKASVSMTLRSLLRMLIMLLAAFLGLKCDQISFPAIIIGMIGLKMAAHLHIYTNVYITQKIRKKGG